MMKIKMRSLGNYRI